MGRGRGATQKRAPGRKRKKDGDDDDDDGDDEEYVAEDEEEEEEEEDEDSLYESDIPNEESFEENEASDAVGSSAAEEEISYAKMKARGVYSSRRQRSRVSNYDELEEDNYEDDEDFSPDTSNEEEDWEDYSLVSGDSSGSDKRAPKRGRRKQKRKNLISKANKRSRKGAAATKCRKSRREAEEEEDDEFIVKGQPAVVNHRKDKKVVKRRLNSRSAMKNRSSIDSDSLDATNSTSSNDLLVKDRVVTKSRNKKRANCGRRKKLKLEDSETSDSDFVISDEDFIDDSHGVIACQRKISKNERKKAGPSTEGQLEESNLLYFDHKVVQSNIRNPAIDRALSVRKPEGVSVENKGKEKEADELNKQLCGICLSEEQKGTIQGILNCCSHYFCFSCIMEWSKVESRCPLCKRRFVTITKSSRSDPGLEMRRPVIRVQMRDQVYQPSEEELRVLLDPYENVVCLECHQGGDDSLMLLCDICDSSAHTYCVGLGREVPEGNWYCECCRIAGEGSLHSQVLDSQASISGHISHGSIANNSSRNLQSSTSFHCPVSSQEQSSQGFDLNVPPRNFFEDNGVLSASQASGAVASTLSGRRAIHRRIRILLSNNRARQINTAFNIMDTALPTEDAHSLPERNANFVVNSERSNLFYRSATTEQPQENGRNVSHSSSDLVPCISNEGRNFRHVEGAKKQVQSIVRHYLKKLHSDVKLEHSVSKKIAKKTTHTILAACGIQHSRSMVSSILQPPDSCSHDLNGGPVNLLRGCCSSCFTSYVSNVVKMFVESL
ncbi:hypothetical protein HPP92_006631 [Vanilla planifolia]|uniref:PHD and RING finger domain-containing protein 1 n=1 Tax=Vanilla planifolia TaxID=51239 RepID=A0A835RP86_VANPL|nr:hypothetical protein HPP92_006631 [Vanilla planifolia]